MRLDLSATRLLALVSPLLAVGCGFEHGSLGTTGPIEANAVSCACTFSDGGTRTLRVQASPDDAEQDAGGTVDLTSDDMDLGEKHVGLRFENFGLPQGATIVSASVQFSAQQSESSTTTTTIAGQLSTNAPTFSTTNDIVGRTTRTAAIPWTIGAWTSGQREGAQRTPDLTSVIQPLVNQHGWQSDSPVVLLFTLGTGHRTADSFERSSSRAPELVVTYTTALTPEIPVCASNLDRDENGFLTSPQASCDTLAATLGGLNDACGLPATVTCTVVNRTDPGGHDVPDSYQSDVCTTTCAENVVDAPACTKYDPVAFTDCLERGNPLFTCKNLHVTATNAAGGTPVCVADGSALAFHAMGQRSTCAVEGTSQIEIGDREPTHDPATAGTIDILGGPCVGEDCIVHTSFLFAMEPITFSVRWATDPTFVDLNAVGSANETTLLDAGLATFEPEAVDGTGIGRRGDEGLAVNSSNDDVLDVGVDWSAKACDMTGALAGQVDDDGLCAADGVTPCRSDADCADVGGACDLAPDDDAMNVDVAVSGSLVNQPPDAVAGADQVLECTSTAGATFELDGHGSTDPDGNLALASWHASTRTGTELSDDLVTTQALGVGNSQAFVLRVIDTEGQLDEDTTSVSVVDTTPPTVTCNAPATMRPPNAALSFSATATDTCDASVPTTVTGFDCYAINGSGRRVSKLSACKVTLSGGTLTVNQAGGVGDHITWNVSATDDSGNVGTTSCEVVVTSR